MKNYSALDRTAPALSNNMNYQQMTARNNAQNNLQDNVSRFSTQSMSTSNTSSSSSNNPSGYPTQRSNMPISSYSNTPSTSSNQQQQYQQQMSYQQQRPIPSSLPDQQHLQQKQQMQSANNIQSLSSKPVLGQTILPATSMAMMSPNHVQPALKQHSMPSERSTIHQPTPNDVINNTSAQQHQGYVDKSNSLPQQSLHGDYPKNLPMLALQQQKVRRQKVLGFKSITAFQITFLNL